MRPNWRTWWRLPCFRNGDKENITVHIPEDAVGLVEALEKRLEPLRDKMGGVLRIKTESRPPGICPGRDRRRHCGRVAGCTAG